ncbi:hypothetical protein F383_22182 [Gossypium arboreum]|uniref:Uncharacterized protein n=1 Tax=Gossypium arboreum TaxID=29729 RepID=A0A0B0NT04_GOSAR|nr:hypothetical protein F383_08721 [Gossypium arboreum]KHG15975.1 hypothetical protein F383_22182 [Gossypium arboreum]
MTVTATITVTLR